MYPTRPSQLQGRKRKGGEGGASAWNSTLNSRPKVLKGKTSKFPDAARHRIVAKLLFALNNVHSRAHAHTHTQAHTCTLGTGCIHSLRLSPQPEPFWPQALTQLYRIPAKKFLYEVSALPVPEGAGVGGRRSRKCRLGSWTIAACCRKQKRLLLCKKKKTKQNLRHKAKKGGK